MRALAPILALAALLVAPLAIPPAKAFIELPSIQNRLIQLALDQISSPGSFEITVESIEDRDDLTTLVGVKVSDGESVWLTLEELSFAWRPTRLAAGELAITRLELVGLDVARLPSEDAEPPELEPQEPWQQGPFDWPRAPISVVIDGVRIERAHIAEGVLPQELRFDAEGSARDKGDIQEVALAVRRTDEVEGRIDFLMRRDFSAGTLRLDIGAREAPGGLVAAAAGFPADAPARLDLNADGTVAEWRLDFDAAVERVFEAEGQATLDYTDRLSVEADFSVTPGPELEPRLRTVLGEQARLRARVIEQADGMFEVVEGELSSPAVQMTATGAVATGPGESDLAVSLVAQPVLADLVEGVAFERFSFNGQVTGPQGGLVAVGELGLRELTTPRADIGALALEGRVAQTSGGARFDLSGRGERMRIDRLRPELLGTAELAADGALDGDLLTLERAALDSPALTASARGSYDLAESTGDLTLDLATPAIAPLAAPYDVTAEGSVEAGAEVALAPERVEADFSAALTGFAMDRGAAERLALSGTVTQEDERLSFDLEGSGERMQIDRLGPELLGTAKLAAAGTLDGDLVTLERAALDGPALTASARGRYDLADATGDLTLDLATPAIAPLAAPYDVTAEGGVEAGVELALAPERISADFSAALTDFAMDRVAAGRLGLAGTVAREGERVSFGLEGSGEALELDEIPAELTREARLEARGAMQAGTLELAAARLESPLLTATASGTVGLEESTLAIDYSLETPELAPVAAAYGVDAAGALEASGRAEGEFAALRLTGEAAMTGAGFAGRSYGTVGLEHDVAVAPVPEGRLAITLRDSWLGDGRAATRFRLEGKQLKLAELEAELFATTLAGSAEVDIAAPLIDGAFDVSVRDLGALGRFAGTEMGGAASGRVTLTAVEGRQDVRATLEATNLGAANVRAARAELALAAADVLGTPRLDLEVTAGGVAAGGAELETLTATASGPLAAIDFSAEAGGTMGDEDLTATLAGRADASGAGQRVTLAEAEVGLGDETMELAEPLELRLGGGTIAAEGLNLVLPGGGALGGDAALHPNGYSGDLALEGLMLEAAGRWLGLPFTAGRLDAEARFDTRPGSAGAELTARGRDVVFEGADFEEVAGRSLAVDLYAGWDGQRLDARAELSGGFGDPFRASLGLPLWPRAGALPTVPEDGALDGRLAWSGRIGDLWALVPAPGHLLDGQADIDLALAGTPAAPQVSGRAEVSAGQYQNLDAGTILTDLTIRTSVSGDRSVGLTLEARDGADGRVRSEATVRLAEQPPTLELTATAERAVLVRRDDVTAAMSGEVALDGPLDALALTGRLTVDKAEVRLVNAMPPGVVTLDGIRIKGAPEPEETDAGRSPIRLDLAIEAERDIFVRGRGLDSEWRMALRIGGDAASPVVTGTVERVRGQFSLIGRAFELERGRVSFDGGREVDPELDIYLQHEDHGIRGGIVVSGRASAPELGFASTPALPEDEVLPRLLFGQSSQSLTGGQALQLAAGLAALMGGGGGGPVAALRQAAGLDVLRLEGESVEDAGVTVGRNVGENVFIGARQGLGGQGSSVTVEVEVFEGVTVDTELDQAGGSNIGITLKKDF